VTVWYLNLIALCVGLLGPGYDILLSDSSFQSVVGTPHLGWFSRSSVWSGRPQTRTSGGLLYLLGGIVRCATGLKEWSELQHRRVCIPATDLVVGALLSR
jgi:hypothetical protein